MRLFSFTAMVALAAAQHDPIHDYCRRHQHQTCVIDSKLYIDGGKVHYGVSVENGSIAQQSKLSGSESLDLANGQIPGYCGKTF
jgi:hypothetical protein